MAKRKTPKERRSAALAEVEAAKQRLAQLEADEAQRIGRIALKAGFFELDLTDQELKTEFDAIASKFRNRQSASLGSNTGTATPSEG